MEEPMYEVRVAGVVPDTHLRDMHVITLAPNEVNTVVYGLEDEAALYGLLARLRTLGLEVVEVRRVSGPVEVPADEDAVTGGDEETHDR
jgi:hypothetical protein